MLRRLDASLSERDRAVLDTLRQLRLATAVQLERLHYADLTARHRRRALAQLEADRLITRLPRTIGGVRAGSAGSVFALDLAGQRLTGPSGPARGLRIERPWTPGLPFLGHTLAISELYVRLVVADRAGRLELLGFQAEPASWRRFQTTGGWATLKPDAGARLGAGRYEDHWFIEVDRGTEAPATIERKAGVYRAYWSSGREQAVLGVFPRVLWLVPDVPRAELLTDVLGRGPADSWQLHTVASFADAIRRLIAGAGEEAR
ncbi:MAG: replication-relaxation family protein [Acidimicrobiales bacterium]